MVRGREIVLNIQNKNHLHISAIIRYYYIEGSSPNNTGGFGFVISGFICAAWMIVWKIPDLFSGAH